LPSVYCLVALPKIGVSTPKAFADWDARLATAGLTQDSQPATLKEFCGHYGSWWSGALSHNGRPASGVPGNKAGDRAETLLLELDRTGIENDFEKVVFPQHPELMGVKRALRRAGALYASLSGSGSALFGLFAHREPALAAAEKLRRKGVETRLTRTLPRRQYWKRLVV
jgi:4-diphosphocytidyl-2-C-methyl-D-erythritol kinase